MIYFVLVLCESLVLALELGLWLGFGLILEVGFVSVFNTIPSSKINSNPNPRVKVNV